MCSSDLWATTPSPAPVSACAARPAGSGRGLHPPLSRSASRSPSLPPPFPDHLVPDFLASSPNLMTLLLYRNNITGTLPAHWAPMAMHISLGRNSISGEATEKHGAGF